MLAIRNVLYPTDFSSCAEVAMPYALQLARRHGAVLHVLYVAPTFGVDPIRGAFDAQVNDQAFYAHVREEADTHMTALLAPLESETVSIRQVHRRGMAPGPVLLDYAAAEAIDVIVMGTHGRRGARRMLLGSVAEEVLRRAACPVLTVPAKPDGPAEATIRRLLVPIDFSSFSHEALLYAHELATLYDAALDLVYVLDSSTHPELYAVALVEHGRLLARLEADARTRLEQLCKPLEAPPGGVDFHVRVGYTPKEIIDFAAERDVDLMVMASHGRTGLERFLLGSITEHVLRGATCPIFVIKSFGRSLLPASLRAIAKKLPTPEAPAGSEV